MGRAACVHFRAWALAPLLFWYRKSCVCASSNLGACAAARCAWAGRRCRMPLLCALGCWCAAGCRCCVRQGLGHCWCCCCARLGAWALVLLHRYWRWCCCTATVRLGSWALLVLLCALGSFSAVGWWLVPLQGATAVSRRNKDPRCVTHDSMSPNVYFCICVY